MEKSFNPILASRKSLLNWTFNVLRTYGVRPREKLSQNFVIDPHLISEILSQTSPVDTVEIGCGIGTLSLALLTRVKRLICIEIDKKLCVISTHIVRNPYFLVINADARIFIPQVEQVVSNIPYHVTSELLVKIARTNSIKRAVLTLQREVAERLLAEPGSKAYGKLTILIRVLFNVRGLGTYTPTSFYPEPGVFHKIVVLERKKQYSEEICLLEALTKELFTQRRRLVEKVLASKLGVKINELDHLKNKIIGKRVYMLSEDILLDMTSFLREKGVIKCAQYQN